MRCTSPARTVNLLCRTSLLVRFSSSKVCLSLAEPPDLAVWSRRSLPQLRSTQTSGLRRGAGAWLQLRLRNARHPRSAVRSLSLAGFLTPLWHGEACYCLHCRRDEEKSSCKPEMKSARKLQSHQLQLSGVVSIFGRYRSVLGVVCSCASIAVFVNVRSGHKRECEVMHGVHVGYGAVVQA